MDGTVNVLYQSSDYYAPFAGVSITSLFENNKHIEKLNVYLLDDHIGAENKAKFEQLAAQYGRNIVLIDTGATTKMLQEKNVMPWRGTYTAYVKLFAIGVLDKTVDRLLYIDSDTIVNGDILPLYSTKLDEGDVCGMVLDVAPIVHKRSIGMKKTDAYYNTGVILFDCDKWRNDGCELVTINHIANVRSKYSLVDQDIVNALFSHNTKVVGPEYNYNVNYLAFGTDVYYEMTSREKDSYYSREEIEAFRDSSVIYHCLASCFGRPWEFPNSCPLTKMWEAYLEISPWHGYQAIPRADSLVYKAMRFSYSILPKKVFVLIYRMLLHTQYIFLDCAKKSS